MCNRDIRELGLFGNRFLAHGEMKLSVVNLDIRRIKPGWLASLPPSHSDHPLICLDRAAVEFIPKILESDPAAFVLLIGQRQNFAVALRNVSEIAFQDPLVERFFVKGILGFRRSRFFQAQGEAALFAIGGAGMNDAGFGGFVVIRGHRAQGRGGFVVFAGADQLQIAFFSGFEARFHGRIARMFARAVAHAAFG
jgi:hypothetical protein